MPKMKKRKMTKEFLNILVPRKPGSRRSRRNQNRLIDYRKGKKVHLQDTRRREIVNMRPDPRKRAAFESRHGPSQPVFANGGWLYNSPRAFEWVLELLSPGVTFESLRAIGDDMATLDT